MSTLAISVPRKRGFRLSDRESHEADGAWYGGKPVTTQLLNGYTLFVPEGERFIIRSCRCFLDRATPGLAAELERLFFQEGGHAREHSRIVETMRAAGLGLERFRAVTRFVSFRVLEPFSPAALRLAAAAAIEHHNAAIATWFLERDLLREARVPELRRLFLWHFVEEIEHKEVVFKLLERASRSWLLRALGLLTSVATFLLPGAIAALLLAVKIRAIQSPGFTADLRRQCFGRDGIVATLARESVRYLGPSFRPSLGESLPLLDRAVAELEALGIEYPRTPGSPPARPLPPAYRERMEPGVARIRAAESVRGYFFSRIGGYDGASVRSGGEDKLNFCTYSYLGLLRHPQIEAASCAAIARYGTGTHGVRLLGGNLELHEELEAAIAAFFGREAAITFSSGFMTNLATICALAGRGDFVLSDRLNHASIVDGCASSGARVLRFRHNDMADLAAKLDGLPATARKLIVVDAVYSMDGDVAPLLQLLELRDRTPSTLLMVDEAHSLGVLGRRGRGIEEHYACPGAIDVLMGTLSKTVPSQGGYIAGSRELITWLRYNARGFMFSAALAPASAAAALAAFELIECEGEARRADLTLNVRYFTRRLREEGFDLGDTVTPIVPVMVRDEETALDMAGHLNGEGIYAMPVVYPAVPRGTERLRMNVTCEHRQQDLDRAVRALVRARDAVGRASQPWQPPLLRAGSSAAR